MIGMSPTEAMLKVDFEATCMADHIVGMAQAATTLGVLVELDQVRVAVEALHAAAHRQLVTGVH